MDVGRRRLSIRRAESLAPPELPAAAVLRALRDEPGLVGLLGDWHEGGDIVAFRPDRVLAEGDDPFAALAEPGDAARPAAAPDGLTTPDEPPPAVRPLVGGGWFGYLGYQLAGTLERLPPAPPRPVPLPHHHLAHYDHVLRRDPRAGWVLEGLPGVDPARTALLRGVVVAALGAAAPPVAATPPPRPYRCGAFASDVDGAGHAATVRRALAHIRAGDVYQVNVCRRLEAAFDGDPLDLFLAGHGRLRPRFAAFLRLPGGAAVASLSPELFLRRTGRSVLTSPIKGTAPLGTDPAALAASAKDRAENVMIVDLMRNDLSRVCEPGSVAVEQLARAQTHTGVHHLVSDVRGRLRDGVTDADLLRATFPPGSCTGTPKVRAMELIHDLERTAREVYTGAVGLVSPLAGLTFNVAIRTFEFGDGRVWLGAGGGIVAESDPDGEARETLVKARPLLDAVGAAFGPALAAEWEGHRARPDPALGVFTTALVRGGVVVDLDAHLARLGASVRACYGLALPDRVRADAVRAAAAAVGPHRLRVTVRPRAGWLEVAVTTTALAGGPVEPWRLVPVEVPGGLGAHKWADRPEPGAGPWSAFRDPLLLDADGAVLEAWRANVFAVVAGVVRTPALDGRILPGTARARALAALAGEGLPVREGPLSVGELASADEVFVTNAVVGVRAVVEIEGVGRFRPGPVAAQLGRLLSG